MDIIVLWLLIGLGLFCLSVITLMIIIYYRLGNRKKVHGIIFLKSGGQKKIKFLKGKEVQQNLDGETYNLENNAVVKTTYKDFIYFMEGNPNPIKYNFETNKPEMVAMELRTILKNDLIQKLFSDDDISLIKLLVIINCVLTALVLVVSCIALFGGSGVQIKQSAENYQFLYNITKNAIMGV
jgi:hypothetical protein